MSSKLKVMFNYMKHGRLLKESINKIRRDRLFKNVDKYTDEDYLIKMGKLSFNYVMNLEEPKTFNEKLNWYKLHYKNPLMIQCVDKVEVDEYVKSKGLGDILIKKLAVWDNFDEISLDNLPSQFVLKTSADSGGTYSKG